jgi:mannosyl-glycoprotein endo-beta-N-acetylglucosaminidase
MSPGSRRAVALAVVLATAVVAPAGAAFGAQSTTTTTTSTTTTSTRKPAPSTTTTTLDPAKVPPPPAFALPIDYGLKLLAQRAQASKDLVRYGSALPGDQAAAKAAQQRWNVLQRKLEKLEAQVRKTQHELDVARDNLRQASVEAYMDAGSGRLETALTAITHASDALDAGRTLQLIGSFSDQQDQLVQEYEALEARLVAERREVVSQRKAADVMLADAKSKVAADNTAIAHAHVRLTASVLGIMQFEKAATSASSPILGPSILTARQLAGYVRSAGYHPRLTVTLDQLAQLYITEGNNAGVRGDVAFAQSILETGGFNFPGGGQVLINDNNFAGIGACDSCKHGFSFPTAEIGVRAQMQSLRIYVDPDLTDKTLKQPLVMPKMLNLGFRGKVQTWWDLWGTWATGAFYGQRVYDIYERMVEWAKDHPTPPPPLALPKLRPKS